MGEPRLIVEELLALCLQRVNIEAISVNTEQEVMEVAKNFESVRKRWLHAELELKKFKELLVKSDVAKAALEVKLKHARNQLDVEMKKRYKVEGDYQYLQRQMQLMCDILVHDSRSSAALNDEQKSLLATFEQKGGNATLHRSSKRLSVIDESSFLSHSDISYDRTDDDVDLDTTVIKPLRSRVREKRRSSMGPSLCVPAVKRGRSGNTPVDLLERKPVEKVIRPETCSPCGKRIRFGKMAVKCRNCRTVAHPECKQKCLDGCLVAATSGGSAQQNLLEDFAPVDHPRVPQLVVECVAEIERRGLEERGLYRVPGGERLVKELRDRFIQGKAPLMLSKVSDIHVLCGLLKDFLRKLKEPLITFRLHRTFMEASELTDEDNSTAVMYQAIAELPRANRDTLAYIMLHLHKVMRSPRCQMDQNNLARVFGPTIVGHRMSEPSPTTIMRDTNTQPKVICRLLSLPEAYWRRILSVHWDKISSSSSGTQSQDIGPGRLFKPLTSPELNTYNKTPSYGSLRGRIRNPPNIPTSSREEPGRRFFTSPS
ncbi:rac GTPase-activating protein 1 isoform X3 [Notolabrus celidotus]|uniref:rac GTPase-activating protein 1 isoform X3 n=1 Tax=Notolabrus celidotus TaxID=1203425 RepID=UPI0014902FF2|nr:rac GTPase-activating protein 1 isoform X3 [Notolabrus celidotus]